MRMKVAHPTDSTMTAIVGWDRVLGFFGEVRRRGHRLYQYDNLVLESGRTSLAGLLHLLTNQGFFDDLSVAEAQRLLCVVDDVHDIKDGSVRTAAEVIVNIKTAAST